MGWFGPSKDEVWRQLSQEIGAEFVEGGFWKGNKVQAKSAPGRSPSTPTPNRRGVPHVTYTRMRAPYVNPEGFRFTIYRKGFFSDLGKLLGHAGHRGRRPEFDEAFIIKGNDEARVVTLFSDARDPQDDPGPAQDPAEVKDSEGWFGPQLPGGRGRAAFPGGRGDQGRGTVEGAVRPVRRRAGSTLPDRLGVQAGAGSRIVIQRYVTRKWIVSVVSPGRGGNHKY